MKLNYYLLIIILFTPMAWAKNPYTNPQIEQAKAYLNSKQYEKAKVILEKEAAKNNQYATYWLANTQYLLGERFTAGSTYQKAAQLGSPWAMNRLVGGYGSLCKYLGWPCNPAWKEKAKVAWKKLADQGDGQALYAYAFSGAMAHEKVNYQTLAERTIKQGGVAFLITETFPWKNNPQRRIELLKKEASKGYAPAMTKISNYYFFDKKDKLKADYWENKAILAGYAPRADLLRSAYMNGTYGKPKDLKKAYFYNQLSRVLTESAISSYREMNLQTFAKDKDGNDIFNEQGNYKMKWLVTPEEQKHIKQQVQDYIKENKIVPNLFLDENSDFFTKR